MKDKLHLALINNNENYLYMMNSLSKEDQYYVQQGRSSTATIVSLLMAKEAIKESGCDSNIIKRNEVGKPIVVSPKTPRYISISHSAGLVACVISSIGEVGIDIEHISGYNDDLARVLMTEQEYTLIRNDLNNANLLFNRFWTMKEAYYKISGIEDLEISISTDFSKSLNNIVNIEDKQYHVHSTEIGDWWMSILADHDISNIDIAVHTINNLCESYCDHRMLNNNLV